MTHPCQTLKMPQPRRPGRWAGAYLLKRLFKSIGILPMSQDCVQHPCHAGGCKHRQQRGRSKKNISIDALAVHRNIRKIECLKHGMNSPKIRTEALFQCASRTSGVYAWLFQWWRLPSQPRGSPCARRLSCPHRPQHFQHRVHPGRDTFSQRKVRDVL